MTQGRSGPREDHARSLTLCHDWRTRLLGSEVAHRAVASATPRVSDRTLKEKLHSLTPKQIRKLPHPHPQSLACPCPYHPPTQMQHCPQTWAGTKFPQSPAWFAARDTKGWRVLMGAGSSLSDQRAQMEQQGTWAALSNRQQTGGTGAGVNQSKRPSGL